MGFGADYQEKFWFRTTRGNGGMGRFGGGGILYYMKAKELDKSGNYKEIIDKLINLDHL